jgi:hypothetical protein
MRREKARTVDGKLALDQDMEDIRRVCSYYLHHDKAKRFHPAMVLLCIPTVLIEQASAFIAASMVRFTLWLAGNRHGGSQSYAFQLSKSFAALAVVVGYYALWMYGNNFCKLAGTVALLVNQNLHSAILFDKSVFEFVQSFVFGNAFLLTVNHAATQQPTVKRVQAYPSEANPHPSKRLSKKATTSKRKRVSYAGMVDVETGSMDEFGRDVESVNDADFEIASCASANDKTASSRGPATAVVESAGFFSTLPRSIFKRSSSQTQPTPATPTTTRDADTLSDSFPDQGDSLSLDLCHIDRGGIEVFEDKDKANPNDTSLNAEEILQDLEAKDTESESTEVEPSNEDTIYSAPVQDLSDLYTNSQITGDDSYISDFETISMSRIDTRDSSLLGTLSVDGGSRLLADDGTTSDETVDESAVEVCGDGKVRVDGENIDSHRKDSPVEKEPEITSSKPWRNRTVRKWMFGGRPKFGDDKKEESNDNIPEGGFLHLFDIDNSHELLRVDDYESDSDQVIPAPVQTVYADDDMDHQSTLDDESSRRTRTRGRQSYKF